MNVIFIMTDTFRRDHVGAYGNPWIHTPNLNRLARESAVFERAYLSSYPTVPNRWDLATGRWGFPFRGWQPMAPEDRTLAQSLSAHGFLTMLIHDTPMLSIDDMNYTRGFNAFRWVRGHHLDPYNIVPKGPFPLPAEPYKLANPDRLHLDLRNNAGRQHDRQFMVGKSVSEAIDWLEVNYNAGPFLLWLDMWDPHEPFDVPWYDWARYRNPDYAGEQIVYPAYGRTNYMTAAEQENIRALYAGKVTMVDRWLGRLLEMIELLGLLKDTLIIWTTDHGHLFGEHDLQGKPSGELGKLYEETTHVPLFIRHPNGLGAGKRIDALVQPPDLMPTILEFLEVPIPDFVQATSLWPLITGQKNSIRDAAYSGLFSAPISLRATDKRIKTPTQVLFDGNAASRINEAVTVTAGDWSYIGSIADRPSELYNLAQDPGQKQNLIDQYPGRARQMRTMAIDFLREHGASAERLRPYLEGGDTPPLPLDTRLWGFKDGRNQWITFASEDYARSILNLDSARQAPMLQETSLGNLLDADPKSLVRMWQYYWAQDLT